MKIGIITIIAVLIVPKYAMGGDNIVEKEGVYVLSSNKDGDKMADILVVHPCFRWTKQDAIEKKDEPFIYYQIVRFEREPLGGNYKSTHYGILIPNGNNLLDHGEQIKAQFIYNKKLKAYSLRLFELEGKFMYIKMRMSAEGFIDQNN